jgi:acyl-CoA dehydrogenase
VVTQEHTDPVGVVCAVADEHARQADEAAAFPGDALDAMRRTGLLGLMVPGRYGGGDGTLTELVDATMRLGRADMSVAMIFAMHCQQVVALATYGGERLREHVLPAIADGKIYLASVTTEPGSGGQLLTSNAQSEQVGDSLQIGRDAPIVTGGMHADGFLITMRAPGPASAARVDLIYAGRDQLRLELRGEWQSLGMRATESVPMRVTGTVPCWQIVGEHGGFRTIAAHVFAPLAHVGWAAAWLGTAAGACSRVVAHIRAERPDPASELLLVRLATARARLDVIHALLRHTVSVLESGRDVSATPVQLLVNTLKTEAADGCFAAIDELVELAGLRHGYLTQSPLRLERAFRDLRSASLNYGNDRLRLTNGSLALMDMAVHLA